MSSTDAGRHFLIMLTLNVLFFLAQVAVTDINPGTTTILTAGNTPLDSYNAGGYTIAQNNTANILPSGSSSISPTTGNIFTDTYTASRNWMLESTGLNYVVGFVWAVPNFISAIGFPAAIQYILSALWVAYGSFILVAWLLGRQN